MTKIKNILLTILYQEIVLLIVFAVILLFSKQKNVDILSLAISGLIAVTISILLNEIFDSISFGPLAATAALFIIDYVEASGDFSKIHSDSDKGSLVMGVIILYFILYIIAVCSKNAIGRLINDNDEFKVNGFQPKGSSDEIPKPFSFKAKKEQKDEYDKEEEL